MEENEDITPQGKKLVGDIADYVNNFIDNRFPNGLTDPIRQIIAECVVDAFCDGARWQEEQSREESRIILDV